MEKVEEKLLNIVRSSRLNENEVEYFEEHVKDYPTLWGNYYLWSVESHNYQCSKCILESGFELNTDGQVRREVKSSFEFFKRDYVKKIIEDGFVLDEQLMNEIQNNSSLNIFDNELYNEVVMNERKKKLIKIMHKIKNNSKNNNYISGHLAVAV